MTRIGAALLFALLVVGACADPASEIAEIRAHVRQVERTLPAGAVRVDASTDGMNYQTDTYTVAEPLGTVRASIAAKLRHIGTHVSYTGAQTRMFSMVFVPGCHKSGYEVRVFLTPDATGTKIAVSGKCAA